MVDCRPSIRSHSHPVRPTRLISNKTRNNQRAGFAAESGQRMSAVKEGWELVHRAPGSKKRSRTAGLFKPYSENSIPRRRAGKIINVAPVGIREGGAPSK